MEELKRNAWSVLVRTARHPRVVLQIGWLIERATSQTDVLLALAMIGDFDEEEEFSAHAGT